MACTSLQYALQPLQCGPCVDLLASSPGAVVHWKCGIWVAVLPSPILLLLLLCLCAAG